MSRMSMADDQIKTVQGLLERLVPKQAGSFQLEVISADNGRDVFEIESAAAKIVLRGNNGVSLGSAFNWYLKHVANCQVSRRGDQLALPKPLPIPAEKIRKVSPYSVINHFNYCTTCYTCAFWSWEDWEREIDVMALSGIRNPLVIVGNEIVWQNVLKKLGYSKTDIDAYLSSSAFTSWWLMGNLEGEGGPLSQNLINAESELAKKILARMRSYGMEPTLQGFCGVVPTTLKKYLPDANIVEQGYWVGGYVRPSVISPLDPQFARIAKLWYAEHHRIYGKGKYYGADLFHEGGRQAGLDLGECARSVQREMRADNPKAVWVVMGWSGNPPRKLLEATDPDHLLVEYCISYPQKAPIVEYSGRPWTFTMINTFGGHVTIGGSLKMLSTIPSDLLNKPNNNCVGIGNVDEGLESNAAVYELLGDMIWETEDVDLNAWAKHFAIRRYGAEDPAAVKYWQLMASDLLGHESENLLCARPRFNIRKTSSWGSCRLTHDREKMLEAGRLLLSCSDKFKNQPTYRSDCIEMMRQLFNDHGDLLYHQLSVAYERRNEKAFTALSQEFLELIADSDRLFSSGEFTLLGSWIARARARGKTQAEKDLMERTARQLVTLWTQHPSDLSDYAYRQWGGLFRDYYLPRWKNFFDNAKKSLQGEGQPQFTDTAAEIAWVKSTETTYPAKPETDAVETAKALFAKYDAKFIAGIAAVKAVEQEKKQWAWTLTNSTQAKQVLEWNVTKELNKFGPGSYAITVTYQRGNKAIQINKAELFEKTEMAVDDVRISVDEHVGESGVVTKDNIYTVEADTLREAAQYFLRLSVTGKGGNDSSGVIVLHPQKRHVTGAE